LPFLFAEAFFENREIGEHEENWETWRKLLVRFPDHIPTHTKEQVFYFAEQGLLRRVDYALDVAGGAPAAHYCFDHKSFGGLVVPTQCRVVGRSNDGANIFGPTAVLMQIADVSAI